MYHTVSGEDELPETPVLQLVKFRELSGYKQEGTIRLRLVVPSCAVVWLCAARLRCQCMVTMVAPKPYSLNDASWKV